MRLDAVLARDPAAEHHFFSGASMAVTARAYGSVGGLEPLPALEDEAFEARLTRRRPVTRSAAVRVATRRADRRPRRARPRPRPRARRLARAPHVRRRATSRSSGCERKRDDGLRRPPGPRLRARRSAPILDRVLPLRGGRPRRRARSWSTPRPPTAPPSVARAPGRDVPQEDELLPSTAPRAARATRCGGRCPWHHGDIVAFIDADTDDFDAALRLGLLGPLLAATRRRAS